MPRSTRLLPSRVWLARGAMLAGWIATVGAGDSGIQWRLRAHVPVICAIIAVDHDADKPADLVVTTTCNAERFKLVLEDGTGQANLRTASSSAGPVQISGGTVTISSLRPGQAITAIALSVPRRTGQVSITLQPL